MKAKFYWYGITSGFVGGIILGWVLRTIETTTHAKVYTLLLDVDYIPGVHLANYEQIEFALHLLVSLAIGLSYFLWMEKHAGKWAKPIRAGLLFGLSPILLFFPLATLSDRGPAPTDLTALFWWALGHFVYGIILSLYGIWAYVKIDDRD
jgi:hypothetical protein